MNPIAWFRYRIARRRARVGPSLRYGHTLDTPILIPGVTDDNVPPTPTETPPRGPVSQEPTRRDDCSEDE